MIIDDLPSISIANDSDEIAIEQGTATKKITKGNFLQEIVSSISSLISDISGKVSKAGDTMTGMLLIKSETIDVASHPSAEVFDNGVRLIDKNGAYLGSFRLMQATDGRIGVQMAVSRKVSGASKENRIRLFVDDNGNNTVTINAIASWRSALGLTYAANDTFTTSAGETIPGVTNGNSTIIYFTLPVDRSMENISTVTATSFNGWIAGPNGPFNNSTSNTQFVGASGYSITCTKASNHSVRITLTKTSAFSNAVNNGVATFFGSVTLKFT